METVAVKGSSAWGRSTSPVVPGDGMTQGVEYPWVQLGEQCLHQEGPFPSRAPVGASPFSPLLAGRAPRSSGRAPCLSRLGMSPWADPYEMLWLGKGVPLFQRSGLSCDISSPLVKNLKLAGRSQQFSNYGEDMGGGGCAPVEGRCCETMSCSVTVPHRASITFKK